MKYAISECDDFESCVWIDGASPVEAVWANGQDECDAYYAQQLTVINRAEHLAKWMTRTGMEYYEEHMEGETYFRDWEEPLWQLEDPAMALAFQTAIATAVEVFLAANPSAANEMAASIGQPVRVTRAEWEAHIAANSAAAPPPCPACSGTGSHLGADNDIECRRCDGEGVE